MKKNVIIAIFIVAKVTIYNPSTNLRHKRLKIYGNRKYFNCQWVRVVLGTLILTSKRDKKSCNGKYL